MKSILDPSFRYTSSVNTDISKTFAKARKAQREAKAAALVKESEDTQKVQAIFAGRRNEHRR